MSKSCPLNTVDSFRVINVFKNGVTDEKKEVKSPALIKGLMTCRNHRVPESYNPEYLIGAMDYTVVMHYKEGKIHEVTYWIN